MQYIPRLLESHIKHHLDRGKSLLLLGARQTGKSTLLQRFPADLTLSFIQPAVRQRYEKNPELLGGEIESLNKKMSKRPLVVLDEIQKVPFIMDTVQDLIDRKLAQFILTGSSARKLRRGTSINLLPGRLVTLHLDPFVFQEFGEENIENILFYGALPGIFREKKNEDRETDLRSYVETYLEEEVRAEALVRNLGAFSRFLELAGLESGNIVSLRALSQEIGISHTTIASFFEILEDCLVAERVDPITFSTTRKKLTKSSRYLLFDMGVRRLCTGEGTAVTKTRLGELFQQYVGLELIRHARLAEKRTRIKFWRDPDGPEVDWVIEREGEFIPIEVKWSAAPVSKDARHLETFLKEYPQAKKGYVICQTPNPADITPHVTAISWKTIADLF
ncbi:MAG: AAA family ATPase [Deltaproteobacteria bacterium]|nr:AAA family ATPase [Deltaproteobacteria bacterium]